MITLETVAACLRIGGRRFKSGTGWFSDGHFAVRGEKWEAMGAEIREKFAGDAASWLTASKLPVEEVAALRIPQVLRKGACESCGGDPNNGECVVCHNVHVCYPCEDCGGTGIDEYVEDLGQAVFDGAGGRTVVQPPYGDLLAGLNVLRAEAGAPLSALFGYDGDELVVVVMPLSNSVREPSEPTP